jgi:hypothetical protein
MTRKNRAALSAAWQLAELGVAAPQVMAHRLSRLALAGPVPSARDQREFAGMWMEKPLALMQAWQAMALACWQLPLGWGMGSPGFAFQVLDRGLQPVSRRVVANARRLSRKRQR